MKISVYRYCTQQNIDWIFAVAIPRWNFIGNMVIAIIVGLITAGLIIVGGTVLGFFSGHRIEKPFLNLIDLFDSLSRMELDLDIHPSSFTEISTLQRGFLQMVTKIRQYRAFIPSHLLSQIDNTQVPTLTHANTETIRASTDITKSTNIKNIYSVQDS